MLVFKVRNAVYTALPFPPKKHFSRFLRSVPRNYDDLVMHLYIYTYIEEEEQEQEIVEEIGKQANNKKQFVIENKKNIGIASDFNPLITTFF